MTNKNLLAPQVFDRLHVLSSSIKAGASEFQSSILLMNTDKVSDPYLLINNYYFRKLLQISSKLGKHGKIPLYPNCIIYHYKFLSQVIFNCNFLLGRIFIFPSLSIWASYTFVSGDFINFMAKIIGISAGP